MTSPLPRGCSTAKLHGRTIQQLHLQIAKAIRKEHFKLLVSYSCELFSLFAESAIQAVMTVVFARTDTTMVAGIAIIFKQTAPVKGIG